MKLHQNKHLMQSTWIFICGFWFGFYSGYFLNYLLGDVSALLFVGIDAIFLSHYTFIFLNCYFLFIFKLIFKLNKIFLYFDLLFSTYFFRFSTFFSVLIFQKIHIPQNDIKISLSNFFFIFTYSIYHPCCYIKYSSMYYSKY